MASIRGKRPRETPEMVGMARRIVRAIGRRVGDRDVEALAGLAALQAEVDAVMAETVARLRSPEGGGYSWTDVGRVLDITRQAAQQRYGVKA